MAKRKRKRWDGLAQDIVAPTAERAQHDPIEREARQIVDSNGNIGNPFRIIDAVARLAERGFITDAEMRAATAFRDAFDGASFSLIKGMPLVRVPSGSREEITVARMDASNAVYAAMQVLGSVTSPAGSCAWHVLGEQMSLTEWSTREGWKGRPISAEAARGILVNVLGALRTHYGY